MGPALWIAIYLPLFVTFFIIVRQRRRAMFIKTKKKRRGEGVMSNELIKSCIGMECNISTGTMGTSFNKVTIVDVVDNWMKVESKGKVDLINVEYIQSIKILTK